ncbi:MAG: mannitol dehydrogenase family protein [Woeseiaceae bacterium]
MTRLSNDALAGLPAAVARPDYDRSLLKPRIVHLGIGNFHRAHQAVYTDAALNAARDDDAQADWGICGVSLRRPDMRDKLAAQDGLYTLEVRNNDERRQRVIGSVIDVLVGPEGPAVVIERMSRADVITLTVTEKAYGLDAAGRLDLGADALQKDLHNPGTPDTVIGYLAAALARRRTTDRAPVTIVCCDNLTGNGAKLEAAVHAFLAESDRSTLDWVTSNAAFPSTMVDRIVPHTTDEMIAEVARQLTVDDAAPVITEPFSQWVIEDRFAGPVPDWAGAGAELVDDVTPYETIKLRMLNGSHSTLAYLGCLGGYATVDAAVHNRGFRNLIDRLMRDEVQPTLAVPPGFDIDAYRRQLLDRFSNTATQHRLQQIAMDGSQKLPQRLVPTLRERLAADAPIDCLALCAAAWALYVRGNDGRGNAWIVDDPLAEKLAALHRQAGNGVMNVLRGSGVFDDALQQDGRFTGRVTEWAAAIAGEGVDGVLARFD